MDIIYRAYDGKEFFDENECLQYEIRQQWLEIENEVIMLNEEKERTKDYVLCSYLKVLTEGAGQILNEILCQEGYVPPWDDDSSSYVNEWFWDDNTNSWVLIQEKIKECQEKIEELQHVFDKES